MDLRRALLIVIALGGVSLLYTATRYARTVQADGFVQDLVKLFDGKVVDSTLRDNQK